MDTTGLTLFTKTINITNAHITNGIKDNVRFNPVGNALIDAGFLNPIIYQHRVIFRAGEGTIADDMVAFILSFDNGTVMTATSFTFSYYTFANTAI